MFIKLEQQNTMYNDMADAVESLKDKGYEHTYQLGDDSITCKEMNEHYKPEDLHIVESYSYDKGTDPGSESSVYALESKSGTKGLLIISYGMYVDPQKARLVDRLLNAAE